MEQLSFEITAELRKLTRGLNKASSQIDSFSKRNEKKFKQFGKSMTNIGQKMTVGLTAPLALLAGQSIRTFSTFDDQMRKVGVTAGATGQDLATLTDTAKELGATTRFSARQAASGLEFMALAGFDTEQSIAAIPDVLNLAAAAALDLGQASDIVTDTMSAFGIAAENASNVSDVFAAAQLKANTSVLQLGEAFKLSAANANSFGTDVETASAILGKLADAGIKGSRAGTTLNAIFRDIKDSADNNVLALNGQNIALADSKGNFRDILDVLEDVEKATANLSQAQRANALDAVFQERSIRGVNTIMSQGVKEAKDLQKELRSSSGTAKSMADTMEGGLGGSLRSLRASFESLTIELGELLAPTMEKIIDFAKNLIDGFKSLDDTTKRIIVVVAGLAAAAGPLLIALGGIIQIIPLITSAFAALTGPIGLIIAGISALGIAYFSLKEDTQQVKEEQTALNRVYENASKQVSKQKKELEKLLFVARDEKATKDERIKAINKLNKISPKYLGDLELETIDTDEARKAIEKYNRALQKKAMAKAAENELTKLAEKQLEEELEVQKKRQLAQKIINGTFLEAHKALEKQLGTSIRIENVEEAINSYRKNANIHTGVLDDQLDSIRDKYKDQRDILLGIVNAQEKITDGTKTQSQNTGRAPVQSASTLESREAIPMSSITGELASINEITDNGLTQMELRLQEFNQRASSIVGEGLANTFVGLGQAIGNSLATGTSFVESAGQVILSAIGDIATQLGKQAIAIGTGMLAIRASFSNPFGAIAAGVALVAIGSAISATANTVGQVGQGSGIGTSTGANVGGGGVDNSFSQSFSANRGEEIILRARGRDLVAVLNAQENFNNALG